MTSSSCALGAANRGNGSGANLMVFVDEGAGKVRGRPWPVRAVELSSKVRLPSRSRFANSLTFRTPLAKLQTLEAIGVLEIGHFGRLCARGDIPLSPSCTTVT